MKETNVDELISMLQYYKNVYGNLPVKLASSDYNSYKLNFHDFTIWIDKKNNRVVIE